MRAGSARRRNAALLWALGVGGLWTSSSLVRGAEVADLVRGHGLSPIVPPRPATEFSLPLLAGGEQALSELSGSWVVLTFWASWCGPCRSEMPSLEAVHRALADEGVAVVGVSVDQQAASAKAFVDQHGLTFPQLWDQRGEVGRTYQASAIPMSYLVDPRGQLVAVSRGARDWRQLIPLLQELEGQSPSMAAAAATPALQPPPSPPPALQPPPSPPPTAQIRLLDPAPRVGREFELEIRLEWTGDLDQTLPVPPKVHLPEGVVQRSVTASTSSEEGDRVVVYRVILEAERPGSFALDPVELRYRPAFSGQEAAVEVAGPTVTVEARTLLGLRPRSLAMVTGGVVASALGGWLLIRQRMARSAPVAESGEARLAALEVRFHEARNLRLQGDPRGACLELLSLVGQLQEEADGDRRESSALEESLRFGGYRPSNTELDGLERQVDRLLVARRPDPRSAARRELRLQDDEERA